jgi:SAM-dependent methyltransferase
MSTISQQERDQLLQRWLSEYNYPFSGWDFSHIAGRMIDEHTLLWDYRATVRSLLNTSQSLLDMGTGGGEFLASLQPLSSLTCATEGYAPNIPVARQRLEPLGVTVAEVGEDGILSFQDQQFDLVINRHEFYEPQELLRVLKSGGHFVTQQVGGHNNLDINSALRASNADFGTLYWGLGYAVKQLEAAGLRVLEQQEAFPVTRFFDVGAIVYYLKAIPWQIPDFSVARYFEQLLELHRKIQADGEFKVSSHRFFIVAQKP